MCVPFFGQEQRVAVETGRPVCGSVQELMLKSTLRFERKRHTILINLVTTLNPSKVKAAFKHCY